VLVAPATAQRVISIDVQSSGWCGRLLHVTYHVAVCGRPRCAGIIGAITNMIDLRGKLLDDGIVALWLRS
jgi:hypothetical protein